MGVKYTREPRPKFEELDKDKRHDWRYTGIDENADNVTTLVGAMQSVDTTVANDNATHITTPTGEKIEYTFHGSNKKI